MAVALFDTNILIDCLKGYQPAIDEVAYWDEGIISAITWMEVMAGTTGEDRSGSRQVEAFQAHENYSDLQGQNSSPVMAHRVRATTFIGAANGSLEPKALVEAVIELEPLSFEATLQVEFERLAHEYAATRAVPVRHGDDPHAASIQRIKDRLVDTHERLSLRIVVR